MGLLIKLSTCFVERRNACIPTTGDIDRPQIQRQAYQVVAKCSRQEFIDLISYLARHPAQDRASSFIGRRSAAFKSHGIEESINQPDVVSGLTIRSQSIYRFGKHRVAEAVHHVRKLRHDGWVNVYRVGEQERINVWRHQSRKLLEHQMLVDHLGAKATGLKEPFSVPHKARGVRRHGVTLNRCQQPLINESHVTACE